MPTIRRLIAVLLTAGLPPTLFVALPGALLAQDLFSPVIVVNDRAVTGYEIDQRIRLLQFFNTPGDVAAQARTQLVDERLKAQELARVGASLGDEGVARAVDDFASRANLSGEEFVRLLEQNGVAYETLRDYVTVNASWRDYIRARFGSSVTVTDGDVERRLAQDETAASGIEVLLSEIIIPAPPQEAARVQATALAISRTTSTAEFEAAARQVSAVPSREQGGRLDWTPITNYPVGLQNLLLSLAPGEVTQPLNLTGAVALLQLRDVREVPVAPATPETIDYAILRIPGGRSPAALAEAARIDGEADTCTDLFGIAQELPADRLERQSQAPAIIPEAVAIDLAPLDPGEATWGRTTDDGATLLFTMLCDRTYPLPEGAQDRQAVTDALRGERLNGYGDALLADLRAAATIVGE